MWDVEYTDQFEEWWDSLDRQAQNRVGAAVERLEASGPSLGRPIVDTITTSRHPNMKELRTGSMRILFAFDPRRTAILLIGGDKAANWSGWYDRAVPEADYLYEEHLRTLPREGELS